MTSTDDIQLDMLSQESPPNGVTISWRNLKVTTKPSKFELITPKCIRRFESKDILRGLNGIVRPGEMVALMGARYAINFPKNIVSLKITYFLL
jgi:hypothetical protein